MAETMVERDGRKFMKVWLPGESPWAEVLAELGGDRFVVRIDNKVAGDYSAAEFSKHLAEVFGVEQPVAGDQRLHKWRFNDVLAVERDTEFTDDVIYIPSVDTLSRH